ncbi:hypothetical protein NCS52_00875300 [Fusarium sp. LHS14.1]|nr:hypothetical protein NCS52_00875300 [Fusarium sp. LHS14.1]
MDQLGHNGPFMGFDDQSMDLFGMVPGSEQTADNQAQTPMAGIDQSSHDSKVLLKLVVEYQIKLNQQFVDLQKKFEQKMDEQGEKLGQMIHQQTEKLEEQVTTLLGGSQMMLERLNDCIGILETPMDEPTYTDSEYSDPDSLDGPHTYPDSVSSQDSDSDSDAFPLPELRYC